MMASALVIAHLAAMALLFVLRASHVIKTDGRVLFAAAFLPVFGELALLAAWLEKKLGKTASQAGDLEMMDREHVKISIYHQEHADNDNTAVPLEDALIIDDAATRRSVMMDILMDESNTYMSAMRQAQHSDDTEVVHYATTALTNMSEKADARLKAANRNYEDSMRSDEALDNYIRVLRRYLDDRMAEGELLEVYRKEYQELLRTRIGRTHDRDDYADLAESCLDSGDFESADEAISVLEQKWEKTTRTLQLRIRYEFDRGNGSKIQNLMDKVRQYDDYPSEVQEILDFWEEDREHA